MCVLVMWVYIPLGGGGGGEGELGSGWTVRQFLLPGDDSWEELAVNYPPGPLLGVLLSKPCETQTDTRCQQ